MKTSQLHKSSFEIYVKIPCPAKVGGNSKQEYKVKFIFDQKDQWWPFPDLSRAREGRQEEGTVTHSGGKVPASSTALNYSISVMPWWCQWWGGGGGG